MLSWLLLCMQDYPGRTKLWHIGVPPSGPMDALAFRLANALVGNPDDAAGLEVTLSGKYSHQPLEPADTLHIIMFSGYHPDLGSV